jgi:hypothetical protein
VARKVAVDPTASKRLFDDEVEALRARAIYVRGSRLIVSADYPDLVVELPHPSGARRRFRFLCDDWDEQPPSVKSVDQSGNVINGEPTGNYFAGLNTGWGLCKAGTREYHAHHAEDPWANHRGQLSLAKIVERVATYYRKASP